MSVEMDSEMDEGMSDESVVKIQINRILTNARDVLLLKQLKLACFHGFSII